MVIRTRDRLIEVARQLFLIKGIENTTMLDIANASDYGRRTIYTYFKNKDEIYSAVVQQETESYVKSLREVANSDLRPVEKLDKFLHSLFSVLQSRTAPTLVSSLIYWVKLDFQHAQKIRAAIAFQEVEFLCQILNEGVERGVFRKDQSERMSRMLPSIILSLERYASSGHNIEEFFSDDFINFTMTSLTLETTENKQKQL